MLRTLTPLSPLRLLLIFPLALGFTVIAPAQAEKTRTDVLVPVTTAQGPRESVQVMRSFLRGLTPTRSDGFWLLVQRTRFADDARKKVSSAALEMWHSDTGAQWQKRSEIPTAKALEGTLLVDPDRRELHVAWSARGQEQWSSVHYQRFDLEHARWIADPERILQGKGTHNQFGIYDLEQTTAGAMVAAVSTNRSPGRPWTSGWSTGLMIRKPGAQDWSKPMQVNVSSYGVWSDLQANGEVVHLSYRTTPSNYVIGFRSYDVAAGRFLQNRDSVVSPNPTTGTHIANSCLTAVDLLGNRYVLYAMGALQPGKGRIVISYASAASPNKWQPEIEITKDASILSGNVSYTHFAICRGPGNQINVLYSRCDEQFANLYSRVLDAGRLAGPERKVASGPPRTFARLCGVRDPRCNTTLSAAVGTVDESGRGAAVSVLAGRLPARTTWLR